MGIRTRWTAGLSYNTLGSIVWEEKRNCRKRERSHWFILPIPYPLVLRWDDILGPGESQQLDSDDQKIKTCSLITSTVSKVENQEWLSFKTQGHRIHGFKSYTGKWLSHYSIPSPTPNTGGQGSYLKRPFGWDQKIDTMSKMVKELKK